ncbi:MAG: leader peptidase (prepilin peptidase)/N-methyltransferase [Rickettsiales bacterium]|jgi:leader peptidase (prepilin peptidase)/N-methyltransferase
MFVSSSAMMAIFIAITGLCFGSFITMASHRLAIFNKSEDISIRDLILKGSSCPSCNKQLKLQHLFPIFSWLFYKGKCGFCANKISIRYPLIEISTALLFLGVFWILGPVINAKLILTLSIFVFLIIMVVVDLEHYFIPDITQIIVLALILAYHLILPDSHNLSYYLFSAAGLFMFGIILWYGFFLVTKRHGIGIDDIKFFTLAGFMLGLDKLMIFMILSGLLGTLFGAIWTRLKKDDTFPFAPALVVSFMICILFQINYIETLGNLLYWFEKVVTKTAY